MLEYREKIDDFRIGCMSKLLSTNFQLQLGLNMFLWDCFKYLNLILKVKFVILKINIYIMVSNELRENIVDYIKNKADDRFLRMVNSLASTYDDEVDEPDTLEAYNKEIDQAIKEVENGETYTQEEARKIAEKW